METTLLAVLLLPWLATATALLRHNNPRQGALAAVGIGVAMFALIWSLVPTALEGGEILTLATVVSDVGLSFRADAAAVLFALVVGTLWPVATVYTVGYLDASEADSQTRFFVSFAASIGAVVGVAFAANLFTLFVCYELLTVATYPLVVHKETETARKAGRKYAAYAMTGGVAVFAGTVLVYAAAGSVTFAPGGIAGLATADPVLAQAAFALLAVGFGVKAAVMPLHGWLPDAMVAPTPVSSLLHAVAVVKSGVFGIARTVQYVYGPETIQALGVGLPLAVLAAITMLVAGLIGLKQEKLKRGLAYSTVSQLSYIVLGLAVLTPLAVQGAFLHLAAHAFMKIVLFFCAGIIYVETHVETISDLRGIAHRLPLTMTAFGVAAAGLIGLPLVAGFVSKWYLLTGLFAGDHLLFAVALLAAGLLKLLFFWPLVSSAFAQPEDGHHEASHDDHSTALHADGGWESRHWRGETSWYLLGPVLLALLVAIVFGIVPTALPIFDLAARVAEVVA